MEVKEEARSMEVRRGGTRRRMRKVDAESMEKKEDEKNVVNSTRCLVQKRPHRWPLAPPDRWANYRPSGHGKSAHKGLAGKAQRKGC